MTRVKLFLIAWILLFCKQAYAQSYVWQQTNGPEGGIVDALISQGTQNVFVSMDGGGVFRSTNRGSTWSRISSLPTTIYSFATNPAGHIFAGGNSIYRSTDGGVSWSSLGGTLGSSYAYSLYADSTGRIYAGTGGGKVVLSMDFGSTWNSILLPNTTLVRPVAATSNGRLFAIAGPGLFRSTDNGASWTIQSTGVPTTGLSSITMSTTHIFVGSSSGVYRSSDGGTSWSQTNTGLTTISIADLVFGPSGQLFALTQNGVFRSTDNGTTWTLTGGVGILLPARYLHQTIDGSLYASNAFGVYRSTDAGNNWTASNSGLKGSFIYAVAANKNGYIFAGGNGIFRSSDLGNTWSLVGVPSAYTRTLAASSSAVVYAMTDNGLYRSTNDGAVWNPASVPNGLSGGLCVSPSGTVLAGISSNVWRSTNEGVSWDTVNSGLPRKALWTIAAMPNNDLYVSVVQDGLYRSTNNGLTWTRTSLPYDPAGVAGLQNGIVLAATSSGAYRSSDRGQTWTATNSGLSSTYVRTVSTNVKGDAIASTMGGLSVSTDGGQTWTSINQGLGSTLVLSLATTPNGYALAATGGFGVYRTTSPISGTGNDALVPSMMTLGQNYPNPFNPSTIISYQLPVRSNVLLRVYNTMGQEIAVPVNEPKEPGYHFARWDAQGLPSGIYFYRLQASPIGGGRSGQFLETKKMVLLR